MAQERRFRVVEYNVENLFDTIHQEGLNDTEFTPSSKRHWESRRYWSKLDKLVRTIAACGGLEPADMVVLCEVENDSVIADLTRHTRLARMGYSFVMTQGSDPRGINVALLYQPLSFQVLSVRRLQLNTPHNPPGSTRDILYVCGRVPTLDTLHVFALHLPSRSGGQRETDCRRAEAANVVRAHADSIMQLCSNAKILILGDFNDEAHNNSIRRSLRATPPKGQPNSDAFYVLTSKMKSGREIRGTYYFRNAWSQLDNIIVSGSLLNKQSRFRTTPDHCRIGAFDFLLERTSRGKLRPKRSFLGTYYHGGYSDHLPLLLDFFY